jgi:LuxR family transcriptional regulator, maltose regulon positive regulatory protein
LNAELISRPDVERRLRDAVEHTPLTLLHAPLGAGKTAAAKMAFAGKPGVVWMEARPWHRDAFIRDVVDTVRGARANFGRMTLGALDAGASATHMGGTFATELAHIDEPLTLIVDNAQVFTGEPGFSHFVDAAVNALPPGAHILAMGRSLPDTMLGGIFPPGKAQIVGGDLLVFNAEDIRALGRHFGREIDDETMVEIETSTEGWAAGVTLAVTGQRILVPTAKGPRNAAEVYLTKELLSRLDRHVIAFLERAAVFETLDLRVLDTIDAFAGARDLIASLRREGALLTEIAPNCYRLHPVLRELAERRLRKRGAASAAHRDAAEAYIQAGEPAAALFHADESSDPTTAVTFLRNHAAASIATGDRARVRGLSTRIDPEGPDANVRWFVDALLEKASGSADVRATLSRAVDAADASKDATIAFQARAQAIEYDIGHLIPVDDAVLDDLARRAEPLGLAAVATTLVMRGWSRAITHDFFGALTAVATLDAGDATVRFNVDVLRAYAQTSLGHADSAEETLDALIGLLENDDQVVLQTLTLVWFARLALVWGQTTAASDAAAQAERLAAALDLRAEEAALYVALAEIATHNGDVEAAMRYAERAKSRAGQAWYAGDVSRVRAFAEIALARAAFLADDYALARELAHRAAAQIDFPPVQRAAALTESAIYTLLCEPSAALTTIARARDAVARASPSDAADAAALATADDVLAFLDAANGVVHAPLLGGCEDFASLIAHRRGLVNLEHAGIAVGSARRGKSNSSVAFDASLELLTRDGPRFEARLARAYASSFMKPRHSKQSAEPDLNLTPREREILSLLIDGLTNKEIAERLIVSPRTVETHVERILGKLEVGSRSRAIAKAIRLGVVSLDSPQ